MKTKLQAILEILGQIPAGPARERLKEATYAERYAAKPKRTPEQIALDTNAVLAFSKVSVHHPKLHATLLVLKTLDLTQEEKEIKFRDAALEVFPTPLSLHQFMCDTYGFPNTEALRGRALLQEERDQEAQMKQEIEEMYRWVVNFSGAMGKIDALGKDGEAVVTKEQASKLDTPEKGTPPEPVEVKNRAQSPEQVAHTLREMAYANLKHQPVIMQDKRLSDMVREKFTSEAGTASDGITITHKEFNDAIKGE